MPLNFETVKTSLYNWVTSVLPANVPAIFFNENSPRPELPYVTLFLNTLTQIGDDFTPRPDIDGDASIIGDREFNIQIQAYGGDPITTLENIRSSLQLDSVLDSLRNDNIVFVQHNPINDITGLLDTKFEPRGSMDVLFRIAQSQDDNLGVIETVELEQNYSDGEGLIYSETVLIES